MSQPAHPVALAAAHCGACPIVAAPGDWNFVLVSLKQLAALAGAPLTAPGGAAEPSLLQLAITLGRSRALLQALRAVGAPVAPGAGAGGSAEPARCRGRAGGGAP